MEDGERRPGWLHFRQYDVIVVTKKKALKGHMQWWGYVEGKGSGVLGPPPPAGGRPLLYTHFALLLSCNFAKLLSAWEHIMIDTSVLQNTREVVLTAAV